jgi:hypothetical protein
MDIEEMKEELNKTISELTWGDPRILELSQQLDPLVAIEQRKLN